MQSFTDRFQSATGRDASSSGTTRTVVSPAVTDVSSVFDEATSHFTIGIICGRLLVSYRISYLEIFALIPKYLLTASEMLHCGSFENSEGGARSVPVPVAMFSVCFLRLFRKDLGFRCFSEELIMIFFSSPRNSCPQILNAPRETHNDYRRFDFTAAGGVVVDEVIFLSWRSKHRDTQAVVNRGNEDFLLLPL